MKKTTLTGGQVGLSLRFDSLRNISCQHDTKNSRRVLVGRALATELLELDTDANVRGYLVDADGKQKKRRGEVHFKIQDTIENYPENFCVLNGGIVIVARDYEVDEQTKTLSLFGPSIINGAQTQGVIRDCVKRYGTELPEVYVTYELVVTKDEALISEISIARNFQNDVKNISIAGSRGILDELETRLQADIHSKVKLKKSETDRSDEFLDTEKLIQVLMAVTPPALLEGTVVGVRESKAYTYSQKATCLKEFSALYEAAKAGAGANAELYNFMLSIGAEAWALYEKWKQHQGFRGTKIRAVERDGGKIVEVPDGILFPILSSFSMFVVKKGKKWSIEQPTALEDKELIEAAKTAYMQIAESNPQTMGKKAACYSQLLGITSIYKKLAM